jgi:AcrR family transcriptional regulator
LRDIAKEAGVSKALLLKYWGTRSKFLIAVLEHERMKIEDLFSGVDRETSVEDICLRLLTAFQANPRYFNLITRMTLDNTDEEVQQWLKERFVYGRLQKVIQRLHVASEENDQVHRWSPEAFGVFAMVCSFALPVLGPKVMEWYGFPPEKQYRIEQEVMMLCVNAMVSNLDNQIGLPSGHQNSPNVK